MVFTESRAGDQYAFGLLLCGEKAPHEPTTECRAVTVDRAVVHILEDDGPLQVTGATAEVGAAVKSLLQPPRPCMTHPPAGYVAQEVRPLHFFIF